MDPIKIDSGYISGTVIGEVVKEITGYLLERGTGNHLI